MADDGILGLLGRLNDPNALYEGALTDPATRQAMAGRGLLAMAGSFADSAMPTRMPTPFGAVLGHAAGALGASNDALMTARLQAAQSHQALATAALSQGRADIIKGLPGDMAAYYGLDPGGGGIPSAPPPGTVPGTVGAGPVGPAPTGPINPELVTWEAKNQGIDPLLAHATADIESSYGANTGNKVSPSNTGVFQRAKADEPGGQNDTLPNQIKLGVTDLVTARVGLRASLGREPTNAEVYLAHQQGVSGATKLITNPDTPAGKLVRPVNISNNGGNPDAPASAFVQHWADTYAKRENKFAPLAASLAAPDGGAPPGPVRMAQATGPTMNDAGPARPVPPPGLLGPSGQTIPQLADQAMAARPQVPGGLLSQGPPGAPPPGAAPAPISPATIATLRAAGATDAEIARIVAAPSGPPPGAPPGPPPGAAVAPPGAPPPPPGPQPGPPTSLIPPPAPAAAVPPITQPQAPPPPAAPGTIPGAPSVAKQQAASRLMLKFAMAGIPLPPDVEATAKFNLTTAQAAAVAAAKSPIEIAQAVAIANGTLPADIAKARAGPAESGAQARQTAAEALGNEYVNMPALGGWIQRKNIPGFSTGGPAPTAAGAPLPSGTALPPGPGAGTALPGTAPAAPGTVPGAIPGENPAQQKVFESNLAQATEQLKPLRAEGLAAPTEIGRADEINDLLGRTKMGWGADTRQRGGMILSALGATPQQIQTFLGVDTTAGATLNKLFLQFSSDAVLRLGSHEAASVLGQFSKAYPSLESDPRAAELMTNALRMQAQWKLDRANAAEAWDLNQQKNMGTFGQNYRGMNGFHESFNKTNDFNDYWRAAAAMSGFADIAWKGTSEADQRRILALIPIGRVHLDPSGTAHK